MKWIKSKNYIYLGNCIDTVDSGIWDATEMAQVIDETKKEVKDFDIQKVLSYVQSKLKKRIKDNPENFESKINTQENIIWIYDIEDDIHYFWEII